MKITRTLICKKHTLVILNILVMLISIAVLGQETDVQKEPKTTALEEVVVTGENKVMSLSKKLFKVGVLNSEDIATVAATNLADLLNYNLNITISPDPTTGKSTISMFGLDGQYVKILLDGIPMASDNGIGNNIDITQINLNAIERIEIVEGAMGVLYGDNAVAGVINIVSKKNIANNWELEGSIQEETVGKEYAWFDEGKHIQNFKIAHKINDFLNASIGASRTDFAGFYNTYKGKDYVNIIDNLVVNDDLRGTEWNPKEQLTFSGSVNAKLKKHNLFYKTQYYNEVLDIYNHAINGRLNTSGTLNPTAIDEEFTTKRFVNNFNLSGPLLGKSMYNVAVSHQKQERFFKEYTYNILLQGVEAYTKDALSQSSNILYSKGFVSNIFSDAKSVNLQLGYEFTNQSGFDAIASGAQSTNTIKKRLENYDFFGVADYIISDRFSTYPGLRFTTNSQFGNKLIWSLASVYKLPKKYKLKANLGSAFRAPNFTELYYYFVDSNHNIQGNPALKPEDGVSVFVSLDKSFLLKQENSYLKTSFKSYYIAITDKIEYAASADEDNIQFSYYNIDTHKVLGFSLDNTLRYKQNWNLGIGATYMGESSSIIDQTPGLETYLWTFNFKANAAYTAQKLKTTFSALLKYNGASQRYIEDSNTDIVVRKTSANTWIDASSKTQLNKNISLTVGARNIANIIRVKATDIVTGAHDTSPAASSLMGNGRSFYIKFLYHLNLN